MESVLVVEDDWSIAHGLKQNLKFEGYEVYIAPDGERGLEMASEHKPDLVLLDVMLPKLNGFEVLRELRRLGLDMPVIVLTAKGEEIDKVRGLDLGADDYMTKPFSLQELLARVRAALRRQREQSQRLDQVAFGRVEIDFTAHCVKVAGEPVRVTVKEMELLRLFVSRQGQVLERGEIVSRVWGFAYDGTDRTLDNFVSRLRHKLEIDPDHPRHLLTVRGVGYQFVLE